MNAAPVRPAATVTAYAPPRPRQPTDLHLDANEGTAPPNLVFEWLGAAGPDVVGRYPDATRLQNRIAQRHAVDPACVVVTSGADDALDRIARTLLGHGTTAVATTPTFEMIPRYVQATGANLIEVPWMDGPFPTSACAKALEKIADVAFMVTPNNPTGDAASADDLVSLNEANPDATIVVDLAYAEYADVDLTELALSLPNTVVVRTFSKAWGLAGLRVGYAITTPELAARIKARGNPYAVAGPSLAIADAWLEAGPERVSKSVSRVRSERVGLSNLLTHLGAQPIESQANFVLARFERASLVADLLAGLGIRVRRFPDIMPALADCLRITCPGDQALFDRLCHALETALAPQAILFDLDGVIADVSGSYRESVLQTARAFGVELTSDDVAQAKARGNANNDWHLTRRLLAERGIDVSLEEVTNRFEEIYQGTMETPGLRSTERSLIDAGLLGQLKDRTRLAIVTGRPRADAMRFLDEHHLTSYFETVVCMEDAPSKPDPAPVLVALNRLGVNSAWMLGDTPDDCVAARGAGVVPIGCLAPGDPADPDPLILAGAARVLDTVNQFPEIFP